MNPEHTTAKRYLWYFMLVWFVINVVQAIFTELAHDEAYYWMYARKLDIGYFDHPPMIATMIRAGGYLFLGELGVRILVVVFSTLLIPVLYSLCRRKDIGLFILLFCASTVFQVYGFIAVPDAPLLFFTALFFLLYRQYLAVDSARNVLLLALCISALFYSKYHGLLVVFFTVVSNPQLFRRKTLYGIIALVVLFYLPHVLWQITNDYPSYQYHVLNKSQTSYNPLDSLEFIGATLMVAGPLTGIIMVAALWKSRSEDKTMRALKFTFFGFVVFFFLSTFNAAIEANWMAASVIPLFVIAHRFISERISWRKWAVNLSGISIVLFAFFRVNLMTDAVPAAGSKMLPEFYGWKQWAHELEKRADGCPVAIMNSYQRASKYSFYTQTEALSLNNIWYRRNQYDIWDISDHMQGKRVALFRNYSEGRDSLETFDTPQGKYQLIFVDDFQSYTKVRIDTDQNWYTFAPGTDVEIPLTLFYPEVQRMKHETNDPLQLECVRYYYNDWDTEFALMNLDTVALNNGWQTVARFRTPDQPGPYYIRFCLKEGWMPAYINSRLIRMDIE